MLCSTEELKIRIIHKTISVDYWKSTAYYHLSLAPLNELSIGEEDVRGRWSTATIIAWSLVTLMVDKESKD